MKISGFSEKDVHVSKERCTCKQKKCINRCSLKKGENRSNSHHDSQNAKEKQHCSDDLEKIHRKHFTNVKSNMKACF